MSARLGIDLVSLAGALAYRVRPKVYDGRSSFHGLILILIDWSWRSLKCIDTTLIDADKIEFERFLREVYFAFRTHPRNSKRKFHWGDCLEPGFLRTIGVVELEPVVERVLRVRF